MIHSIRKSKSKWLALLRIPAHASTHSCYYRCLKYMSTTITVSQAPSKSLLTLSGLIKNIRAAQTPASLLERLESSERPKHVLQVLQDCNFSETQIKAMISRWPQLLLSNPGKTLNPKLEFLFSKGLSVDGIYGLMLVEPSVMLHSLERHLIPLFRFLEDVAGSEQNTVKVIKRYPFIIRSSVRNYLEFNVETLRSLGFSKSRISSLMLNNARAVAPPPARFNKAVKMVKEMGFSPAEATFGFAVDAVCWGSTATWEGKLKIFMSYGLSYDEFLVGFRKKPIIMTFKGENLKLKLDFFVNNLNWSPLKVMKAPRVLTFGLTCRTVPRLSVMCILLSNNLVKQVSSVQSLLKVSDKKFVEKFVEPYKDKAPEVLEAHQGKLKIQDWSSVDINSVFKNNEYVCDRKTESRLAS